MAEVARIAGAVVVSTDAGSRDRLGGLFEALASLGIPVEVVATAEEALAAALAAERQPQALLVDSKLEFPDITRELCAAAAPGAPIVLFHDPSVTQAIAAFRAGAADVLDPVSASDGVVERALRRLADRHGRASQRLALLKELREALEEFLRDLVRTERRSIDLERQVLARQLASRRERPPSGELVDRRPVVLIVDADRPSADLLVDRLEDMGLITFAFTSGEEALAHSRNLAANAEPLDLALVDARLPGMSGLEAVAELREQRPQLSVLLMTSAGDAADALEAADAGIAGYVIKPFEDLSAVLEDVRERALENLNLGRERHYIERIKRRHEKVLTRYRRIAATFDRLE
jgi:DNA-binding NtrC family response regulator